MFWLFANGTGPIIGQAFLEEVPLFARHLMGKYNNRR